VNKAVFLDRDGTLIVDKVYLNDPEQIEYLPGVFEALRSLRDAGYIFVVVTNQSGIPRGKVTVKNLVEIHRRIRSAFAERGVDIIDFSYAPYLTDFDHPLRKPNAGMLHEAAERYRVDLTKSWMIGDRMLDVEAGHRAGCRSILVGDRETPDIEPQFQRPEYYCEGLLEAARFILGQS
jgi:histidinol-phosphate phosphatase family protein